VRNSMGPSLYESEGHYLGLRRMSCVSAWACLSPFLLLMTRRLTFDMLSLSVLAPAEEETRGGTLGPSKGSTRSPNHESQLRANRQGSSESARECRPPSLG
jgi:hypothetical protein